MLYFGWLNCKSLFIWIGFTYKDVEPKAKCLYLIFSFSTSTTFLHSHIHYATSFCILLMLPFRNRSNKNADDLSWIQLTNHSLSNVLKYSVIQETAHYGSLYDLQRTDKRIWSDYVKASDSISELICNQWINL